MKPAVATSVGVLILACLWLGQPSAWLPGRFTAHMVLHMGVVAVAAPLIAFGIAGSRLDPWRTRPNTTAAIVAAALELVVVWGWHAPAMHNAARADGLMFLLEQASFLLAGVMLWLSALGVAGAGTRARQAAGVVGLLLTSMHMTLLGALIALAPRQLYLCAGTCRAQGVLGPLEDQALGGTVMLAVGGTVYLAGGLLLLAKILRYQVTEAHALNEKP